jgi:predicted CXXCH cytochrome family protein
MTDRPLRFLACWTAMSAAVWLSGCADPAVPKADADLRIDSLPPIAEAAYRNTQSSASFIGVDACRECHPAQHQSWTETAHSRALAIVDAANEPPPGRFTHAPSGRSYEIELAGSELRHRESARAADGTELVLADLPMQYVIGSGRFSRSYLASRDGFLIESPATWYASLGEWRISPGYDRFNPGFERPINGECIGCHAGRAERVDDAVQKFEIPALSIDCERCHGPGSLHAEYRRNPPETATEPDAESGDLTIVNPSRLTRTEREAVCAQCHLHSAATVDLRGRRRADFRPGLRLQDFCVHYGLETPNREMRVVGHMEQMRLSACYRGSDTLTCTTCHDPHRAVATGDSVAYFRNLCLDCHHESSCGLPKEERLAEHADDDCAACHMPKSKTDIPHFAFTHHRIGIHTSDKEAPPPADSSLVPLDDVSHLPQMDRMRGEGLAYVQAAGTAGSPEGAAAFQQRGLKLLEEVRSRGLVDPEVDATLSRLYWRVNPDRAIACAESVLKQPHAAPESRATALFTLATSLLDRQKYAAALPLLEELVTLKLASEDWYWLSVCRQKLGDADGAIAAAQRAAEIAPQFHQLQEHLARLYADQGETAAAKAARQRAAQLKRSSLRLPRTNLEKN